MKFGLGDIVRIKGDLVVGGIYYMDETTIGDTFTSRMRNNMAGREATIVRVKKNGYVLDMDKDNLYADGMLELVRDIADEPYTFNYEVEALVLHMKNQHYKGLIDKALDERLHETDPEEFQKIVNLLK